MNDIFEYRVDKRGRIFVYFLKACIGVCHTWEEVEMKRRRFLEV